MDLINIDIKLKLNQYKHSKAKIYNEYEQNQIGGHPNSIIAFDLKILKKSKLSEFEFYQFINSQYASETLKQLLFFIPNYQGTEKINNENYLIMENLHCGFEHFNIMDIKLGKITWSEKFSKAKIERKQKNNTNNTTSILGFRVTGILTRDCTGNITLNLSKRDVDIKIRSKEDLIPFFVHFVSNFNKIQKNILNKIIKKIENILSFFRMQNEKKFISSSLYFVIGKNNKVQVKLIDFANVEDNQGNLDYNVIEALENLVEIWKQIAGL